MVKAEQIFLVYLKTNIISFPGIISAIFEKGEKIGGGGMGGGGRGSGRGNVPYVVRHG